MLNTRGATGGGASPPAFHTLTKDMFLIRGATHFTLGLRSCIISSFLLQIYLRPPLKIAPLLNTTYEFVLLVFCSLIKTYICACVEDSHRVLFKAEKVVQSLQGFKPLLISRKVLPIQYI